MIPGLWQVTSPPMSRPWASTVCASSTLESFLDEKSGGFQIQTSELSTRSRFGAAPADCNNCHPSLDQYWSRCRPGGQASLGGYPLGAGTELSETGVAMATTAAAAWVADLCPFLA